MLVLTRKLNEGIIVDGDVEITVLQVRGNRIRLGIRAPEHVSIRRGELSPIGPAALADKPDARIAKPCSKGSDLNLPQEIESVIDLPIDPTAN